MRTLVAALTLATLLLIPREAHLSGSSEVELRSRHFAVRFESVRKIFRDPDDEGRWHSEWRARARQRLAEAQAAVEKRIPAMKKHGLAAYDEALPEVCAASPEEPAARGAVRCSLSPPRPFGLTITVALRRAPSAETREALGRILADAVATIEEP